MFHSMAPLIVLVMAALSPGPNNLIVLRHSIDGGARKAGASIATIAMSGAAMSFASGLVLARFSPPDPIVPAMVGSLLLSVMAAYAWLSAGAPIRDDSSRIFGPSALATFQLVNPKAWILVGAVNAVGTAAGISAWEIALTVVLVTGLCLSLWAALGAFLARLLQDNQQRLMFDRIMAILLLVFAVSLPFQID
jgi:threonine/homoserine/homoserine lactone efflux protein